MKVIFFKKLLKFVISNSRSKKQFFFTFCNFNYRIVPMTTRRTCAKSFKKTNYTDCEIIAFEVEEKSFFSLCFAMTVIPCVNFLNNSTLSSCTTSMHMCYVHVNQTLEIEDVWNILKCTLH